MDVKRVNQAGEAIRAVVESHTYGWANSEALREVKRLADEALLASEHHSDVSVQVTAIKSWAAMLYSARKHRGYDQGSQTGADAVRRFIFSHARTLARWGPQSAE